MKWLVKTDFDYAQSDGDTQSDGDCAQCDGNT